MTVWDAGRMTYRPYPNRDRALRQLARGRDEVRPLRAVQPSGYEAAELLTAAFAGLPRPGIYVLSSRRPGVVGGPA